ncbi:hypothetical protein BCV70DRAFT_206715 [Testicularia cyperi]|uniref:Uncharacterized protein n=1 Tax=Testicularia cyperi TaxID=1882483 RepID=A0A317XPC8_9BASI|nr:hypothetical protein BCV70DRAFT_206715 [Testicularia cyperi]
MIAMLLSLSTCTTLSSLVGVPLPEEGAVYPLIDPRHRFWREPVPQLRRSPSGLARQKYASLVTYEGTPVFNTDQLDVDTAHQALRDFNSFYIFQTEPPDDTIDYVRNVFLVHKNDASDTPLKREAGLLIKPVLLPLINSALYTEQKSGRLVRGLVHGWRLDSIPKNYKEPDWEKVKEQAEEFPIPSPDIEYIEAIRDQLQTTGMARIKQSWSGYRFLLRATKDMGVQVKYLA